MDSSEAYLQQAEECERQAAEAQLASSRKALLATAAMWRKLAEYPNSAEALARHHIAGFDVPALKAKRR
jgi:hypothetical protein